MIIQYIKRSVILCLLTAIVSPAISQVSKSEYFMRTSYMRTYLNPALTAEQGQLVVPILPNIGANVQTNTINLDHLTFNRGGERVTFLHPMVSDNDFLKDISKNNYVRADVNYKIFAFSKFTKGNYLNVDIGVRTHTDVNLPKSVFQLLKVGFDPVKGGKYDLKNISATTQSFVEMGISQSRTYIDNTLAIGGRVKFLLGIGYLDLNAKHLDIEAGAETWRATSQVVLHGSAPGVRAKYDSKGKLDGFDFGFEGIPGYGAGIDVGVVYDVRKVLPVLNGLKISGALNDIGFISWTKSNSLSLYSPKTEVIITPSKYPDRDHNSSLSDIFDDAIEDLRDAINLKEQDGGSSGRTTALRMTMLLGAEYEFIKRKLSVGALYSARFGNYYTSHELTLSGNYQPYKWLGVTGSYSVVHSAFDTFGLALHLAPRKGVTFFFASDYILPHVSSQFIPTSSKGVNMHLGFSIPIGKVVPSKI